MDNALIDKLKSWLLYPLPHHAISRLIFWLTRRETQLAQPFMRWFARRYGVDMNEAKHIHFAYYTSFNAFFTRELKETARVVTMDTQCIACPVDGTVSQAGRIHGGQLFQAKGHTYSLTALLGGNKEDAAPFIGGKFATLYLSPRDYHRIHMPLDARLSKMLHIPGRLFSVAPHTVRNIPGLFARNERVVALFDSAAGNMAMILVGAINVAAIETVWAGLVTPPTRKTISHWDYQSSAPTLTKGSEMGRFNMGSTVILLMQNNSEFNDKIIAGGKIKMGESIGMFTPR